MSFSPTISDYISALENPDGVFRTLASVVPERDIYGAIALSSGNSAAIFRHGDGRFMKCYIRPNRYLRTIYDYVENIHDPLLPKISLLADEMFVHTPTGRGWVDIVEGEWTDGDTLDVAILRAVRADNRLRLTELADAFDTLWQELQFTEWAHGDLKPENIVVTADGFRLIDCDAMWIPSLAGCRAVELGTPPYRDPMRTSAVFDKSIDHHPAKIIAQGLHILAAESFTRKNFTTFEEFVLSLPL